MPKLTQEQQRAAVLAAINATPNKQITHAALISQLDPQAFKAIQQLTEEGAIKAELRAQPQGAPQLWYALP